MIYILILFLSPNADFIQNSIKVFESEIIEQHNLSNFKIKLDKEVLTQGHQVWILSALQKGIKILRYPEELRFNEDLDYSLIDQNYQKVKFKHGKYCRRSSYIGEIFIPFHYNDKIYVQICLKNRRGGVEYFFIEFDQLGQQKKVYHWGHST